MTDFRSEPDARAALDALPELGWRPFARDDLPAIADFYAECESFDDNPERTALASLQEFWDAPRSVPAEDTLAGYDAEGQVVATAWAGCNRVVTEKRGVHLGGAVHPARRGLGIGRAVLRWELAHGSAWDEATREDGFGPLIVRLYAPADQADVRDLATRHGLETERYFVEMSRRLGPPAQVPVVDGIRLEGWDPIRSDEVHEVVNSAFEDHWGHTASTAEMWQESITSHAFRPQWSVLAIDGTTDRVVGVALNAAWEQDWDKQGYTEGYTDELGVLRSHRGRGIATALLHASIRHFGDAGLEAAGLGVDVANPSGALRLYESLGYLPTARTCVHQLSRP